MELTEIRLEALKLVKNGHDWRDADYIIKAAAKIEDYITNGSIPSDALVPETPTETTVD